MKTNALIAAIALTALGLSASVARADQAPAQAPAELVYMSQLPSAASLMKTAAAQGLTVTKIDQTSGQTIVTYRYPNGQLNTVSYELLPAAETATATGAPAPTTVPVPTAAPSTAVVYQTVPADYYSPYYAAYAPGYYYPWGWYAPVGISLGFGFGHGFYHGGGRWR